MSNFITYAARLLMPLDTDTQEVLCPECEQVVCDCETIGSQDTWSTEEEANTSDEDFLVDDDESLEYGTETCCE